MTKKRGFNGACTSCDNAWRNTVPSERALVSELREALDEVLPPAPWLAATVAEDLRRRRSNRSMGRGSGGSPSRAAVAAGLVMVLLAAGVGVAFLATQL